MEFYRGSGAPGIDEEVNVILESSSIPKHKGNRYGTVKQLTTASFLKPMACIGPLFLAYSLSIYFPIESYTMDYFKKAGPRAMAYKTDSVILGLVDFILTAFAPFITSKVSKKILFVTCGFVSSTGLFLGNKSVISFNSPSLNHIIHNAQIVII